MGKKKAEEKRFCRKCGSQLSSLNASSECFRHHGRKTELQVWFPVNGSSSGPSGNAVQRTLALERGIAD